jgi:hypothetical protein
MEIESHSLIIKDFSSDWYKKWAKELKQDKDHLDNHSLRANKFWQNAVLVQALWERGVVKKGNFGLGFGVGTERLPALFAKYGVKITATDQDFKQQKAKHWAKYELATGIQSLNKLEICDKKAFSNQLTYIQVDMNDIPKKLYYKYDFLWSNCALGHLGSIKEGLNFIIESLNCLKPGGWAVHTTELNILSLRSTADNNSNVVIFRLLDIYRLQLKLVKLGYEVSVFNLNYGNTPEDKRISISPKFGNDFSKIQVMGYLATQIILLVHKPIKSKGNLEKFLNWIDINKSSFSNTLKLISYSLTDTTIKSILNSQKAALSNIVIHPKNKTHGGIKIKKGETKSIFVEFINNSKIPLFGLYGKLGKNNPIVLATSNPNDRPSKFIDKTWPSNNRLTTDLWTNKDNNFTQADYVLPKQNFAFQVTLNPNNLSKGTHKEEFTVIQESKGWFENSSVELEIEII